MAQESFTFDFNNSLKSNDFIESSANEAALKTINKWPNWQSHALLLYGEKSSGKTHISYIWQALSKAKKLSSVDIYNNNYDNSGNYIIDTIQNVHDETALFHLFNSTKENGGNLLLISEKHPANLSIRLPDLRSRLNAIDVAVLGAPDDDLLRAILFKHLSDRQFKVEIDVINYIIARIERSFEMLEEIAVLLDKKALEESRNITIPLARTILEIGERNEK